MKKTGGNDAGVLKPTHSFIIGGTRGIGRALIRILAGEGHALSVIGRRAPAEADRGLPRVDYWALDLTQWEPLSAALAQMVKKNGPFSNVVFLQRYQGKEDPWAGEMETSLTATHKIIEALVGEKWISGNGGSLVMVSSVIAQLVDQKQPLSYHVAKAGLNQMVRYYAFALGPRGIRVNGVSPCTILKEESKEVYLKNKPLQEIYRRIIPLGRMGTAEEIAQVIAFLCGPKASFVTGQNIVVDGGMSLQWQENVALQGDFSAPAVGAAR